MTELTAVMNKGCDQRAFLHDYLASGARRDEVAGLGAAPEHQFAERALLLSQPQDLVIAPAPLCDAYLDYLKSLSAQPLFGRVLAPQFEAAEQLPSLTHAATRDAHFLGELASHINSHDRVRLSSYYAAADSDLFRRSFSEHTGVCLDQEGGTARSVQQANRKERAYLAAVERGVAVVEGGLVARASEEPVAAFAERVCERVGHFLATERDCIVRGCRSQSGLDTIAVRTEGELHRLSQWLLNRPAQTHYLVEQFVDARYSPNVQGWIAANGSAEPLCIVTDQRLDASSAHYGNSYPHDDAQTAHIPRLLDAMSGWLSDNDFRGCFGADLMTVDQFEAPLFAELNARINAATYFISLHEKLNKARRLAGDPPLKAWLSHKKMPTRFNSFEQLRAATDDILYAAGRVEGCLPVASGLLQFGYLMLVTFANSVPEAERLEREFRQRID